MPDGHFRLGGAAPPTAAMHDVALAMLQGMRPTRHLKASPVTSDPFGVTCHRQAWEAESETNQTKHTEA